MRLVESDPSNPGNPALEWQVAPSSQPNIFVEASAPSDKTRINNGAYYFSQLDLKMNLEKEKHFGSTHNKVLRLHYETQFVGESIFRCELFSMMGKNNRQVPIIKGLMCHPPRFMTVDVPIR